MTPPRSLIDEIEDALARQVKRSVRPRFGASPICSSRARTISPTITSTLVDDLLQRLATTIEKNARAKLFEPALPYRERAAGMVRNLSADHDIRVAQPILRYSPRLTTPA